ncbi:hypothetical protein [Cryptosporangium arvum]|uniref:Peptidase inhibitor family I36 n=1 Tax=Cryptosporangium arvum DSM 44712 TaxID=927661 RepID=A0A010ZYQ4_9ACTN|nr:hypothetical protein [Cryptosporangium arvum]EXG82332.1 hypothetical protein CryarDRAFT_3505 [Cryptosporangium arvum DSM 44712]
MRAQGIRTSNSLKKAMLSTAVVATTVLAGGLFTASPATAEPDVRGCAWPKVCFYLSTANWISSSPTASYQDLTSGFQTLGSRSRGADFAYNSRNDDGAFLRFSSGITQCLPPNQFIDLGRMRASLGDVVGLRIMDSPTC